MPNFFGETGAETDMMVGKKNSRGNDFVDTLHLRALVRVLAYPGQRLMRLGRRTENSQSLKQYSRPGLKPHLKEGFKLVLLGNSGAGKSSTLYRWLKGEWLGDSGKNMSTIGAAFCVSHFEYDPSEAKKLNVEPIQKVDIWDTAGQERYRSMLGLYYRNADLGLLVVDLTEDPEEMKESLRSWIHEYSNKSGNDNLLLIGNKKDLLQGGEEGGYSYSDVIESAPGVMALREIGCEFKLPVVLISAYKCTGLDQMIDFISQRVWGKLLVLTGSDIDVHNKDGNQGGTGNSDGNFVGIPNNGNFDDSRLSKCFH